MKALEQNRNEYVFSCLLPKQLSNLFGRLYGHPKNNQMLKSNSF